MTSARVIHLSKMTGQAGSEGHLLILLAGLRARGVDAHLWVLVEPSNPVQLYVDRAIEQGIPVKRLPIVRHLSPGLVGRLRDEFRAARPDIVHTHLLHADLHGIVAARWARVPGVISSRHNDDKFRAALPMRWLNRWLWSQTDAGIAISEAIRAFSIQVEGARPDRMYTVHYGLDPRDITAPPDAAVTLRRALGLSAETPILGSICRLIEQKGLIYSLRAFAQIADEFPLAHYVIAGEGNLRSKLDAEAKTLGLTHRVHFLGWRDDARALMAGLDALVAPSLWEGFGLVFLEAMALGVPVISTHVSAIPEVVVDGETGWLVPPGDAEALAVALRETLASPNVRRARGAAGRRRLETQFCAERMIERTLEIYETLEITR